MTLASATRTFERAGAPRDAARELAREVMRVRLLPTEQKQWAATLRLGRKLARVIRGRR